MVQYGRSAFYKGGSPHHAVVLRLPVIWMAYWGWPVNECSHLKLGHTGQLELYMHSPSHDSRSFKWRSKNVWLMWKILYSLKARRQTSVKQTCLDMCNVHAFELSLSDFLCSLLFQAVPPSRSSCTPPRSPPTVAPFPLSTPARCWTETWGEFCVCVCCVCCVSLGLSVLLSQLRTGS